MTSLNTHIPIEFIKKSEKLSRIYELKNCIKVCYLPEPTDFLTIADIIDNAEELFGSWNYGRTISRNLLEHCLAKKKIKEISQYILDNIK